MVVCSRLSGYHHLRVGFTVSKRMGNAVVRNRCKRRLREVAYILLKDTVAVPRDYVFIARKELFNAPWKAVVSEISKLIYVRQAC